MFTALHHRNFRLYLTGQLVSLIGTWMQQLAVSWLVYSLTHSTFWVGTVAFCTQIPTFILGIFAGVFVDRTSRHLLLKWTQTLFAIQASILSVLTLLGKINLVEITVLAVFQGIITAIDTPTRQAFVVEMIEDKADLTNAIALNSSVMNGTRLIGPALAGICIATFGEGVCFLLNALSFIAVLWALMLMRVPRPRTIQSSEPILESLQTGIRFAFGFRPIGTLLFLLASLSLIGSPYTTLFPEMADVVFKGGAHTLGVLTSCAGLGAFLAAFFLTSRKNVLKFGRMIGISALIFALSLFFISKVTRLEIVVPFLIVAGFTMMLQMASSNMLIQTLVEDDKRGRMMSLFTLSLMGVAPFGSLIIGTLAESFGISLTLGLCGGCYLFMAIWYLSRIGKLTEDVEPIYLKLGLLTSDYSLENNRKPFVF